MITIEGSKIKYKDQEVDLTQFQGQMVRVFLDNNLKLVVNPQYDCYWQIAEVYLLPVKTTQQEKCILKENVEEEFWITRSEGDTDEIEIGTGEIVKAGFWWCNYQKDVDFEQTKNGIKWLGERRPQQNEQYPVVIRRTVEKIEYENVTEPLDISKLNVTIFELPKEA